MTRHHQRKECRRRGEKVLASLPLLVLPILVMVASCGDATEATSPGTPEPSATDVLARLGFERGIPLLVGDTSAVDCPAVPECQVTEEPTTGNEMCLCSLGEIEVNPDDPPPDTAPSWPDPPGWWPEIVWEPSGGEPGGEPGGEEECDWGCPVDVTPTLTCTTALERGGTATCKLTVESDMAYLEEVYRWVFQPDFGGTPIVKEPGVSDTWSGTVVTSGDVRVVFRVGGSDMVLASRIKVTPRNWAWDGSKKSFVHPGSPGDLDNCMGTTRTGLMADVNGCTAGNPGILINPGPNQGFSITPAGGPNASLWYVTSPTTRMDLRTQLARKYRADELKHSVLGISQVVQGCSSAYHPNSVPPQNNESVNTICFQEPGFANLVAFSWNHEKDHLDKAQQEAVQPHNDIYADWEPVVERSENEAFTAANRIQNEMHVNVADSANSIHTGGSTQFSFWYHTGSGIWDWATVTVHH